MRTVKASIISDTVSKLYLSCNYILPADVLAGIKKGLRSEKGLSKKNLEVLCDNAAIAVTDSIPLCQDTGLAIVFLKIGQEVRIEGDLAAAVNSGVAKAVKEGLLRSSVVKDPFDRKNTGNNTPAIIHTEIVKGSRIEITVLAKGAGAENMSALKMLKPSEGKEGVEEFVLETVKNAGPNPCPPVIVGVGIGGNFETCALLAKKALLRKVGTSSGKKDIAKLEKGLLKKINKLKIGPSGLGGKTTALAVNIETLPCHIASLPVAVNIECHSHRHMSAVI